MVQLKKLLLLSLKLEIKLMHFMYHRLIKIFNVQLVLKLNLLKFKLLKLV